MPIHSLYPRRVRVINVQPFYMYCRLWLGLFANETRESKHTRWVKCMYAFNFPHYWPFAKGIYWSSVNSPCKRPKLRSFEIFHIVQVFYRCKTSWLRSLLFWGANDLDPTTTWTVPQTYDPFWACPCHNSSPVHARIIKFGPEVLVQSTLVKILIVLGSDWPWSWRSKLKVKISLCPVSPLE